MIYLLRGDTIGFWDAARIEHGPDAGRRFVIEGVRAMGTADERFSLKRVAAPSPETECRQLTFALCEPSGDLLVPGLVARPKAWEGFGCGRNHIVFDVTEGGARVVFDLDGLPRTPGTIRYDKPHLPKGGLALPTRAERAAPFPSVCEGTQVLTRRGRIAVERLMPGDGIWTLDRGIRPLRWLRSLRVVFDDTNEDMRPVRIEAGALGLDLPSRPLLVSPDLRILVTGWRAELFFGLPEVLVPASQLTGWDGIARDTDLAEATYHGPLLETHEVLHAGGLMCESVLPRDALSGMPSRADRHALMRAVPTLGILGGRLAGPTARTVVDDGGRPAIFDPCLTD